MTFDSLFYENWRLTTLCVLLLLVSGLAAMNTLPKQEDPLIAERFGNIFVYLPGATAERMESLVAEPLERALRDINEIKEVESSSLPGAGIFTVQLHDWVRRSETDTIWAQVSDRLTRVRDSLPPAVSQVRLRVNNTQADALVIALTWEGRGPARWRIVQRLAEDLELLLAATAGTRSVQLFGHTEEKLLLEVDPAELVAANLTVAELAAAVRNKDGRRPAGRIDSGSSRLAMDLFEGMGTPEQVRNLPVQLPGTEGMRLGDLAQVQKSLQPLDSLVLVDGQRAVLIASKPEATERVDAWAERQKKALEEFRASLPPQVGVQIVYDQSHYTVQRLNGLMYNLLTAALIVLIVLIFFQGLRPAIVISVALPLTCLGTLALMVPFGVGLQQMSVTGMIISLGLLIDNPIVVVDHYQRLRREGASRLKAIRTTSRHLRTPLLASTLTTIFAFMPIVAGQGSTSEFVGTIAGGVILAVGLSLVLSLTVIPAFNAYWEGKSFTFSWWNSGYSSARLRNLYISSIDLVVRRPAVGVAMGLTLPFMGFLLFPTLERNFFPPVDRNMYQVQLSVWSAGSLQKTRLQVERVREIIAATPGMGRDVWFIGGEAVRPFYNVLTVDDGLQGAATAFIYTDSARTTRATLADLQAKLRRQFPGMRIRVAPFGQGPPISAPLEVRLIGEDLAQMREAGEKLRALMLGLDEVTYSQSSLASPYPRYVLYPRQEELLASGVTESALADFMAAAVDGLVAGSMMDSGRQLPMVIRFPEALRGDWQRLKGAPLLRASDGSLVPLEAVSDYRLEPGLNRIRHRDGQRSDEVRAWIMPFALASNSLPPLLKAIEEADFALPAGVQMEIGGESEESGDSIATLLQTASFFGILMLFCVVLAFSSFIDAAVVAMTAALSVGLAFFGLWVSNQIFGFNAVIGMLGLVGLAINGTIIVLSALKRSPDAMAGDPLAIRQAILDSTRHILATTVTTVLGLSPLMLSNQTFWHPLVWTIAGGVSGSAIIALYMMPAVFSLRRRRVLQAT